MDNGIDLRVEANFTRESLRAVERVITEYLNEVSEIGRDEEHALLLMIEAIRRADVIVIGDVPLRD